MAKKPIKKPSAKKAATSRQKKQTDNQQSVVQKISKLLKRHKLIVFLSLLVLLFPASFVYEKYKDWDNAQLIKGLAKDFPELVSQIEAETGLDLEIKRDCMTTTEKSGSGVRTCELSVGFTGLANAENKILEVIRGNQNFIEADKNLSQSHKLTYRNKDACDFWSASENKFYVRCLIGVRNTNVILAIDEFNR